MKQLLIITIAAVLLVGCNKPSDELLLSAAESDDLDTVKEQLIRGADIESRCIGCGGTPLAHAAKTGSIEIVKILLNNNANVNPKDKDGDTPLHSSSMNGHLEITKLLVNRGADINTKNERLGATCLHAASFSGHEDIVDFLVAKKLDINATEINGLTPIDLAKMDGHTNVIKILKQNGGKTGEELKAEGK